jgi:gliding motility-associated lipoprotein GldD
MRKMNYYWLGIIGLVFLASCQEEMTIPKPPTYLRLELPDHSYTPFDDNCPYMLEIADSYNVKPVSDQFGPTCHKDIDLGKLNGTIHLSYIDMEEPLSVYVNYANDKVDEHKVKATAIEDKQFIYSEKSVFCTLFELKGDVASPFQFYLTDSVSRFVSGVVYFNSKPNYDSIKPSLEYLKVDLEHLIEKFEWKK